MSNLDTKSARTAMIVGHAVGMIDMVSLPLWVGGLVGSYGYSAAEAGGLVTFFLIGVVTASCGLAPFFHRKSMRWVPGFSFALASVAFAALWFVSGFKIFLLLHLCAGLSVGCALSAIHGTIGRTSNPHRTFAFATTGFGVFSVLFTGVAVQIIANTEPRSLFLIFASVMAIASVVNLLLFPRSTPHVLAEKSSTAGRKQATRFKPIVWFLIAGLLGMNFNQAMNFSFVERIATDHGWGGATISYILICVGLVSLIPAPLAVFFEKKLNPFYVGVVGALLQAILSLGLTSSVSVASFAASAFFTPFVMIFSHTFLFGILSKVEPTGRAVAANPAIAMGGGALAPFVGGALVQTIGYGGVSIATAVVSVCVVTALLLAGARLIPAPGREAPPLMGRPD